MCLDQAEHLGAVVLGPVRPAQAAARDRAEAQVHALDLGAVDEDLAPGPRIRQPFDGARIEFDRQRAVARIGSGSEMIGTQDGFDQVEVAPDDRVVIDVRNFLQRILDLGLEVFRRHFRVGLPGRIEARDEQREQRPCDLGIAVERGGDETLALRDAGLLQVAAVGSEHCDLA